MMTLQERIAQQEKEAYDYSVRVEAAIIELFQKADPPVDLTAEADPGSIKPWDHKIHVSDHNKILEKYCVSRSDPTVLSVGPTLILDSAGAVAKKARYHG